MSTTKTELTSRIVEIRKELSLDQKDFSALIGCTRQHLYSIERGVQIPSWKLLETIAEKTNKNLIVRIE